MNNGSIERGHLGIIQRQECDREKHTRGGIAWGWDIFGHQNEERRKNTEMNVTMRIFQSNHVIKKTSK